MVPKHLGTLGKPGRRDMDACAGGGVSQTATAGGGGSPPGGRVAFAGAPTPRASVQLETG